MGRRWADFSSGYKCPGETHFPADGAANRIGGICVEYPKSLFLRRFAAAFSFMAVMRKRAEQLEIGPYPGLSLAALAAS